eukprot:CAMPEP_0173125296 /NCGR_PEP_ID=MMETSP1102-20130122/56330_1 /TAXON_ID=49646 /ORGANISM="Geminigera sp., Strain Caron Lab Isolate" /LENGTH=48 /DNA_ID= /DNA_START= /DNA_END= /DNA_ORIENTATION=
MALKSTVSEMRSYVLLACAAGAARNTAEAAPMSATATRDIGLAGLFGL